ncbi:aquaporin, partial [Pedobacter sp.]|nr:aquaporin [Candidatus Saccharibacteria bacterium]
MAVKAPVKSKKKTVAAKSTTAPKASVSRKTLNGWVSRFNKDVSPQALLAEMGGVFVLVSSVLFTSGDAFFTGITLIVLALGVFAISGANLNPAVSFGLWTARKMPATRMFAYWVAQFLGAIAAIVVVHLFSGLAYDFSLGSFGAFEPKIFFAELIGTAVFLFGLTAAWNRGQTDTSKAVGMGLALFVGLIMATGLLSEAVTGQTKVSSETSSDSRLQKVNNV